MIGWKWVLNPQSVIYKVGTPTSSEVLPGTRKTRIRTPNDNLAMFERRIKAIEQGLEPIAVPAGRGAWE